MSKDTSSFFMNFTKELEDFTLEEHDSFFPEFYNKIFADEYSEDEYSEDETSNSDLDNYEIELEQYESENEQSSYDDYDKIIKSLKQIELVACVVIDFINDNIQRCGQKVGKMRQLHNLFDMWEVDRDAIKEVNGILSKLGVCDSHFQFDNKYLHKSQDKKLKGFETGTIQWRRCISCEKFVTFFLQGMGCTKHSWLLNEQHIQVLCIR